MRIATDYACGLATALAEARLTLPERGETANARQAPAARRFGHAAPLTVMH